MINQFNENLENLEINKFSKELGNLKNEIYDNPSEGSNENPSADFNENLEINEGRFWWITLSRNNTYDVPWIANSPKSIKNREFPNVRFGNCRLSKGLGRVVYENALVWGWRRETHQETYYSQRVLPWGWLNIPGRHVAQDGTVRDWEGFIAVAAPLNAYPKWTKIMTTLWPGKVYDTWHMKGKSIDIYVNW